MKLTFKGISIEWDEEAPWDLCWLLNPFYRSPAGEFLYSIQSPRSRGLIFDAETFALSELSESYIYHKGRMFYGPVRRVKCRKER